MAAIFIFGTLCHPPLFEVVAGCPLEGRPALLPGRRVVWVAGKSWPMLAEGDGASGLLIDVSDNILARLESYEACFGYHLTDITVDTSDGPVSAQGWSPTDARGDPGAPWSLADWAAEWGALTTLAAAEAMRQLETYPPSEVGHRFGILRSRAQSYLSASQWQRPTKVGRGATRADTRVEAHERPYEKFFGVEEIEARFRQFDGTWSAPVDRAVFRVADAVTVLPYDPVRDRILLIEQVRFGALAQGDAAPWLLEPIAGMIDGGETPEATARREAEEEARVTLGALHFVSRYYPSPGGVAQVLFSYVAEADLPDNITGIAGEAHEGEDIQSHLVSFDEAVILLETGDMANAPLILSFQWLMMHRDRLRASA